MVTKSDSDLPFSQACEDNKAPILEHLRALLKGCNSVLEVGAGTGQHAVHFAQLLPHLTWQPSDVSNSLGTLALRVLDASVANLREPVRLDVDHCRWKCGRFDAIFTANTLHIMSKRSIENFFVNIPNHMNTKAQLIVYGPFKYDGKFTTLSNSNFDVWLKTRNTDFGLRDFEWVSALAEHAGLQLKHDFSMPANNQLLVWEIGL